MGRDDEGFEIDAGQVFSQTGWFSQIFGRKRKINRCIQAVYIVGPELLADGTPIRNMVDGTTGRLLTNPYTDGATAEISPRQLSLIADTGQVNGNASGSALTSADGFTYEIWAFIYSYDAVGIASRTTIAPSMASLVPTTMLATGVANSLDIYTAASTSALTDGQDTVISLWPGGNEVKNLNGTLTLVTGRLQLPVRSLGIPGLAITAATAGLAADKHRAVILGRRVV
jgi:hypothetical protein